MRFFLMLFAGLTVLSPTVAVGTRDSTTVGIQAVIDQPVDNPTGGSQGVEGYVRASHDTGTTALMIGTIGNVELAHRATVTEARALQGDVVITNDGHTAHATDLYLGGVHAHSSYHGPVNVDRVDYVTFDNGWSIRPDGDNLIICNAKGQCHGL